MFPRVNASMDTATVDCTTARDLSNVLSLNNIRQTLIRLEDTIIFGLIERAQFARNSAVYEEPGVEVPGCSRPGCSLLEYILRETEQIHGRIRRYTSPDENAYFPEALPSLLLPPITYEQVLAPCAASINLNESILKLYLEHLMPEITEPGDDGNYGSAAMYDVMILQALSKRIHYGKFVAESKFLSQTEKYTRLIHAHDSEGLMAAITDAVVEAKVIQRVARKAAIFGQDVGAAGDVIVGTDSEAAEQNAKVRPQAVAQLYKDWVMPLTKKVEVDYLLRRLED
ncbi:Chorismate mutase 1, chloroplastic [Auxenochlorella protothecoides]|uniref:Chorismate mutase n=2 Tax=Auxenochlorella protothecoides TaxID=3075 RepID=A0A087SIL9_AUXPR|nr:Chorismate mutase 1, chloroplastic [Auxenochlorella protothecoides]KFM25573.1 Chorismate mutase 1, chloroplastic [Auxenochlorella protothecoides]